MPLAAQSGLVLPGMGTGDELLPIPYHSKSPFLGRQHVGRVAP